MYGKKTILFVDEIHRFNKGQQDYLLPFVEDGTLVLIGATTENPYFEVNGALLSRSIIFELKSLEKKDIRKLLDRAVTDPVKGLGSYHAEVSEEALEFVIRENSSVVGVELKDLRLKNNLLVGCINRGGKVLIPRGDDCLMVGDTVVVVTSQKCLRDIEDILEK